MELREEINLNIYQELLCNRFKFDFSRINQKSIIHFKNIDSTLDTLEKCIITSLILLSYYVLPLKSITCENDLPNYTDFKNQFKQYDGCINNIESILNKYEKEMNKENEGQCKFSGCFFPIFRKMFGTLSLLKFTSCFSKVLIKKVPKLQNLISIAYTRSSRMETQYSNAMIGVIVNQCFNDLLKLTTVGDLSIEKFMVNKDKFLYFPISIFHAIKYDNCNEFELLYNKELLESINGNTMHGLNLTEFICKFDSVKIFKKFIYSTNLLVDKAEKVKEYFAKYGNLPGSKFNLISTYSHIFGICCRYFSFEILKFLLEVTGGDFSKLNFTNYHLDDQALSTNEPMVSKLDGVNFSYDKKYPPCNIINMESFVGGFPRLRVVKFINLLTTCEVIINPQLCEDDSGIFTNDIINCSCIDANGMDSPDLFVPRMTTPHTTMLNTFIELGDISILKAFLINLTGITGDNNLNDEIINSVDFVSLVFYKLSIINALDTLKVLHSFLPIPKFITNKENKTPLIFFSTSIEIIEWLITIHGIEILEYPVSPIDWARNLARHLSTKEMELVLFKINSLYRFSKDGVIYQNFVRILDVQFLLHQGPYQPITFLGLDIERYTTNKLLTGEINLELIRKISISANSLNTSTTTTTTTNSITEPPKQTTIDLKSLEMELLNQEKSEKKQLKLKLKKKSQNQKNNNKNNNNNNNNNQKQEQQQQQKKEDDKQQIQQQQQQQEEERKQQEQIKKQKEQQKQQQLQQQKQQQQKQQLDKERIVRERIEKERIERVEKERIERVEKERVEKEEKERVVKEREEKERIEKEILLEKQRFKIGKFKFIKNEENIIGRGSNGTLVYRGQWFDRVQIAIKVMSKAFNPLINKEIETLIRITGKDCPNLIKYIDQEEDSDNVYLGLTLCQKGSIQNLIDKNPISGISDYLSSSKLSSINLIQGLLNGIKFLHDLDIVHNDLNPRNILIKDDGSFIISDLGLSKMEVETSFAFSHHGPTGVDGFHPAEVLLDKRKTKALDIFSMGCLIFYILTDGKHPFGDKFSRTRYILKNKFNLSELQSINPVACDLVELMISHSDKDRPLISQVLNHPLFWSAGKKLSFIDTCLDCLNDSNLKKQYNLSKLLNSPQYSSWNIDLNSTLLNHIPQGENKPPIYKYDQIYDLIRLIRNTIQHHNQISRDIKLLQTTPTTNDNEIFSILLSKESVLNYFLSKFNTLILHCFKNLIEIKEVGNSLHFINFNKN